MVNARADRGEADPARAAERALAISYAPVRARAALTALFALDARLRAITLAARDPTIGLMRLTWWADALERLDSAPAPAEPLLRSLAAAVLPLGADGAALAGLVGAWEPVLEGDVDWGAVARRRGDGLFALAAAVLAGGHAPPPGSGRFWAAVDLARDWPVPPADRPPPPPPRWWRPAIVPRLRALTALALLARYDAAGRIRPGDPRRVARLLTHRLTGR